MSPVMRLLQETPEPEPEAEGGGIDWASVLFFGGAVLGFLNWLTMSFLRERTSLVYFSSVPTDPIDQAQVVTLVGAVGMMMGTLAMIIMAVFCHGPPSSELMYSAAGMHLMFFIDQIIGLIKGTYDQLKMPKGPIIFWAVVNFFWTLGSVWAARSEQHPYKDDETVFGWDWNLLFWITGSLIVVLNAVKSAIIGPFGEAPANESVESDQQKLVGSS